HAIDKRADRAADAFGMLDADVGAVEQRTGCLGFRSVGHGLASSWACAWRRLARRETELLAAPVIALTSSWLEASGRKMPLFLPSLSTTMRSATARTSSML